MGTDVARSERQAIECRTRQPENEIGFFEPTSNSNAAPSQMASTMWQAVSESALMMARVGAIRADLAKPRGSGDDLVT